MNKKTLSKVYLFDVFLHNMCLKCPKSGRKLVRGCRTTINTERKGITRAIFSPPPGRFSPPPEDVSATPWKKSWNRPWAQRQEGLFYTMFSVNVLFVHYKPRGIFTYFKLKWLIRLCFFIFYFVLFWYRHHQIRHVCLYTILLLSYE